MTQEPEGISNSPDLGVKDLKSSPRSPEYFRAKLSALAEYYSAGQVEDTDGVNLERDLSLFLVELRQAIAAGAWD